MRKIPSVFMRNYDGDRRVFDEVVPGCEWVLAGEGRATVKWDGTCCAMRSGQLFKRYDRKLTRAARNRRKAGKTDRWLPMDFKPAPDTWEAAEAEPNLHTGHWPGWVPVGDGPEDQWHREAMDSEIMDGTYELMGPKVQGNPHGLARHELWPHGETEVELLSNVSLSFKLIQAGVRGIEAEGLVFHHSDGRMAKVKRKDFGLAWPGISPPFTGWVGPLHREQ